MEATALITCHHPPNLPPTSCFLASAAVTIPFIMSVASPPSQQRLDPSNNISPASATEADSPSSPNGDGAVLGNLAEDDSIHTRDPGTATVVETAVERELERETLEVYMEDIADDEGKQAVSKRNSAMTHFNRFLLLFQTENERAFGRSFVPYDELTFNPHCDGDAKWWRVMIGKFFWYLTHGAANSYNCTKPLAYWTATGYTSSVKVYYERKFRDQQHVPPVFKYKSWKELRAKMRAAFLERSRLTGKEMENPHVASTTSDREAIALGCVWGNGKEYAEFYHLNNSMVQLVGRSSEVASLRLSNISVKSVDEFGQNYDLLWVKLQKDKNGKFQELPVYPHRDKWYEDWYFSLIYLFLMTASIRYANSYYEQYVFPTYAEKATQTKEGKIDSKVSSLFSEVFAKVCLFLNDLNITINKALSSHHGKKASSQKMAETPFVSGLATIFRAGWVVRGLHSLFDYVVAGASMLKSTGKALSNWTTPIGSTGVMGGGRPPTLSSITTSSEQVTGFVDNLFLEDLCHNQWHPSVKCMLTATLLRHYASFVEDLETHPLGEYTGPGQLSKHIVVSRVEKALIDCNISHEVFSAWQKEVKHGFFEQNCLSLPIESWDRNLIDQRYPLSTLLCDPRCLVDHFNTLSNAYQSLYMSFNRQSMEFAEVKRVVNRNNHLMEHAFERLPVSTATTNTAPPCSPVPQQPSAVRFSVTVKSWGSTAFKSLSNAFIMFFDGDCMNGYMKDKESEEWRSNPKVAVSLKNKHFRLKSAVKHMLYFSPSFPPPKPLEAMEYPAWKRHVTEIATQSEQAIISFLYEDSASRNPQTLSMNTLLSSSTFRERLQAKEATLGPPTGTPTVYLGYFSFQQPGSHD